MIRSRALGLKFDRTLVMGVVNVTPDSFSDGGNWSTPAAAIARAKELARSGADLVDIGGESTRPGAIPVPVEEELARVVDVVRAVRAELDVIVSIDTYKAAVAEAAVEAGADLVNDVSGGTLDPELFVVAARHHVPVVVGHLRGTLADMQSHADYGDVVTEVVQALAVQRDAARALGVPEVWIDPGLGFAKRPEHNLALLARFEALRALGCPIVVGASRKSFLGALVGKGPTDRELGTAAAHAIAIEKGANVVRVHDVAAQLDAVRVASAIARVHRPG